MKKDFQGWSLAILTFGIGALYLGGGPVYDDHYLLGQKLQNASLAQIWTDPSLGGRIGGGYFRPLGMSIMAILGTAGAIHVFAAFLHAASATLIRHTLGSDMRATFAAALFAAHPLCSEALGWASSLFDVLALVFGLLSWHLIKTKHCWSAGVALGLGLLCKESAIAPPLALAIVGGISIKNGRGLIASVASYGLIRLMISPSTNPWNLSGKAHLVDEALLWPIGSLLVPMPLTPIRDILATPDWALILGGIVAIGLGTLAYQEKKTRAGVLLIALGPLLALPPTLDSYFAAERYAYLSVLGLSLTIGSIPILAHDTYKRLLKLWPLVFLICAPVHYTRAQAWKTDISLFSSAANNLPTSSYAWHYYGYVLMNEGQYREAATAFLWAIETGHPHPDDRLNRLIALCLSDQNYLALTWAENGPKNNLNAQYMAWWGRAAVEAGYDKRALQILKPLKRNETFDGPEWVEKYWNKAANKISQTNKNNPLIEEK